MRVDAERAPANGRVGWLGTLALAALVGGCLGPGRLTESSSSPPTSGPGASAPPVVVPASLPGVLSYPDGSEVGPGLLMAPGDSVQLRWRSSARPLPALTVSVDDTVMARVTSLVPEADGVRFSVVARRAGLVRLMVDARWADGRPGRGWPAMLVIRSQGPIPSNDALRLDVVRFIPYPLSVSPGYVALFPVLSVRNVSPDPQVVTYLEADATSQQCGAILFEPWRLEPGAVLEFVVIDRYNDDLLGLAVFPVRVQSPPSSLFGFRLFTAAAGTSGVASSPAVQVSQVPIEGDLGGWLRAGGGVLDAAVTCR